MHAPATSVLWPASLALALLGCGAPPVDARDDDVPARAPSTPSPLKTAG